MIKSVHGGQTTVHIALWEETDGITPNLSIVDALVFPSTQPSHVYSHVFHSHNNCIIMKFESCLIYH
jgi:hypothetical protein